MSAHKHKSNYVQDEEEEEEDDYRPSNQLRDRPKSPLQAKRGSEIMRILKE